VQNDHRFAVSVEWIGNRGTGTSGYREYGRDVVVTAEGKPDIPGSSARVFRGDAARWNPEEQLIAALSQCHLLSYLHVATQNGIVVERYADDATGTMQQEGQGGRFTEVTLRPVVTISSGDPELARTLHAEASRLCFIASSVNFPVRHEPTIVLSAQSESAG
jgi:organic hydroperoxide reductase OsmC/OhrA